MMKCPNGCGCDFVTTVTEVHDWVVDSRGEFVEDLGCTEMLHKPREDNIWTCKGCGAEAVKA